MLITDTVIRRVFRGGMRRYWRVATLTLAATMAGCGNPPPAEAQAAEQASDPVAAQLVQMAAEGTKFLPKALDGNTTITRLSAEGRVLIYHHSLARREADDAELTALLSAKVIPLVCNNPQMLGPIKTFGVTYRYSYTLPDRATPLNIDANLAACRSLGLAD